MIQPVMMCDRCGRIFEPPAMYPSYAEIRTLAGQAGWHVGSPKDFDVCPPCLDVIDNQYP